MASVGAAVDPQTELAKALDEIERQREVSDISSENEDVSDSSDFSDNTDNENDTEGAWGSDGNSVNLQQDQASYGNRPEQNNDERAQPRQADGGRVAGETQPEAWREIETEAIYECMRKGWPLHVMNIQSTAREIDAKRNPKGW